MEASSVSLSKVKCAPHIKAIPFISHHRTVFRSCDKWVESIKLLWYERNKTFLILKNIHDCLLFRFMTGCVFILFLNNYRNKSLHFHIAYPVFLGSLVRGIKATTGENIDWTCSATDRNIWNKPYQERRRGKRKTIFESWTQEEGDDKLWCESLQCWVTPTKDFQVPGSTV